MPPDDVRRKNLTNPIRPGEVRNPTGKNGSEWLTALRDYFANPHDEKLEARLIGKGNQGKTRFELALRALFLNAIRGETPAQKVVTEQLAGRPLQQVEVTGPDGKPFVPAAVRLYLPANGRDVVSAPPPARTPPAAAKGQPRDE
jgi:hypothetical protein